MKPAVSVCGTVDHTWINVSMSHLLTLTHQKSLHCFVPATLICTPPTPSMSNFLFTNYTLDINGSTKNTSLQLDILGPSTSTSTVDEASQQFHEVILWFTMLLDDVQWRTKNQNIRLVNLRESQMITVIILFVPFMQINIKCYYNTMNWNNWSK